LKQGEIRERRINESELVRRVWAGEEPAHHRNIYSQLRHRVNSQGERRGRSKFKEKERGKLEKSRGGKVRNRVTQGVKSTRLPKKGASEEGRDVKESVSNKKKKKQGRAYPALGAAAIPPPCPVLEKLKDPADASEKVT